MPSCFIKTGSHLCISQKPLTVILKLLNIPFCPCSINADHTPEEIQKKTRRYAEITEALLFIQHELNGYIPKSVISEALKKIGLREDVDWLPMQGQCVCLYIVAKHNIRHLVQDDIQFWSVTKYSVYAVCTC